jgi:hypothetical protein
MRIREYCQLSEWKQKQPTAGKARNRERVATVTGGAGVEFPREV